MGPERISLKQSFGYPHGVCKHGSFTIAVMPRRFRRTCPVCERPDLKNISTHLYQVHGLSFEVRKPCLRQAKVSSRNPYTDLSPGEKPSEGEQETKKIRIATTLGAKKKRNDLTKREEKMTNAPVCTAASEPSQHTTET